jgi:hypothetical protein
VASALSVPTIIIFGFHLVTLGSAPPPPGLPLTFLLGQGVQHVSWMRWTRVQTGSKTLPSDEACILSHGT